MNATRHGSMRWLFLIGLFCVASSTSVALFAAESNVSVLTQQPKAETDKVLDELDEDSTEKVTEAGVQSASSVSGAIADKKISGNTVLYISFSTEDGDEEATELNPLLPEVKIYTVDDKGYLEIGGVGRFKLSGLTASEAELRLSAEPILKGVTIDVELLPVEPEESEELLVFGQSIFDTSTEGDTTTIPVPGDYVVGPGDEIVVQLYGTEELTENVVVSREGVIDFPKIGPVAVAGMTFDALRANLAQRVEDQLIGVKLYITMGELRSINVMVVGEVVKPGNYVANSLSTVIDLLSQSGGLTKLGSMRAIQLKRGNRLLSNIDLYELLLQGETKQAMRLQSGDVVLVPPLRHQVAVSGEVKRPAIYELKAKSPLGEVLGLAGGLRSSAYTERVVVERFSKDGLSIIEADVSTARGRSLQVIDGDKIVVNPLNTEIEGSVKLFGHVLRDGGYAWHPGMTISDIIPSPDMLKKKPDMDFVLLKRQLKGDRNVRVLSVNLRKALDDRKGPSDVPVEPNDEIYVFGFESSGQRQYLLQPVIDVLKTQGSFLRPAQVVSVEGGVFEPGFYPLTEGMKVSDLVRASGSYTEIATANKAEITRVVVGENKQKSFEHLPVDLAAIESGNVSADIALQPYDTLLVKKDPRWTEPNTVELTGEVLFPGVYPIARGETLSSVIERAGGLTDIAFPQGAVLSRVSVKEAESKEMLSLADKLEIGMKATILERADENLRPNESLGVATDVIGLLRGVEPLGRVVIDLPKILDETDDGRVSDADVMLMHGDALYIPKFQQSVSVVGEVNHPTTLVFEEGKSMMDYISRSGGITKKSKDKLAFVIRADGSAAKKSRWPYSNDILPGDTIVVPMDVEKIRKLKAWSEIASIFGNILTPTANAVSAAAAWKQAEALEDSRSNIIIGTE